MKIKKILVLITIVVMILSFSACDNKNNSTNGPETASYSGMGTITDFTVFGEQAKEAIEKGIEIMVDIEGKMSLNISSSEVNKINSQAGIKEVQVSDDTFEVIKRSIYYSQLSDGRFDITIAPITNLWNIGNDNQRIPSDEELNEVLPLVNYEYIILDEENKSVFLERKGMEIDLGGIAKGYVADKIISTFKEMGVENALVSVGGNIKVLGQNVQKDRLWNVGLRHPRKSRGSQFAITSLQDGQTVVTSGDYERYFMENDIRYHHIFNAKTGKPSDSDVIGVSIITDNSMDADSISTSVLLLGSQEGIRLINGMNGVEAVLVTKDLKVIMTEGLENQIKIDKMQL